MKKWVIVTSIVAITVMIFGMMIGAMLVNKFSKPTYIIQQSQPQSQTQQLAINYGQR